jgi:hypothetical protein
MAKSDPPKCPNGHPANSSGNCFDNTCPYRNDQRHDGGTQR